MTTGGAIYTILSGNANLIAVVPVTGIVAVNAPMNTANPMIMYSKSSTVPEYDKVSGNVMTLQYEVDIFSNSHVQAEEIADLVRAALDLYVGSFTGFEFNRIRFDGEDDRGFDPDNNSYHVAQGYTIRIKYD
jgi:hypothetical protein